MPHVKRQRVVERLACMVLLLGLWGQPTENPFAERLMRTLKEEEVYLNEYRDFAEAYSRIGRFLEARRP